MGLIQFWKESSSNCRIGSFKKSNETMKLIWIQLQKNKKKAKKIHLKLEKKLGFDWAEQTAMVT